MNRTIIPLIGLLALTAGLALGQGTIEDLAKLLRVTTAEAADADRQAQAIQAEATDLRLEAAEYARKATELQSKSEAVATAARAAESEAAAAKARLRRITTAYEAALKGEPGGGPSTGPGTGTGTDPGVGHVETNKHTYASNTAAQNKAAFLPPKRASRLDGPPRETLEQSWLFGAGEAPDMADLNVYGIWRSCINVWRGSQSFHGAAPGSIAKNGNLDLVRVSFQPSPTYVTNWGDRPSTDMKWGLRRYNLGDTTVVDCDFTDIPVEHGIYDNLGGHGLYQGCTFHRIAGQAIQIAYRDANYGQYTEPDNMPFTGEPVVIVEDCHAVDIGTKAGKAGFPFTFFDYGTTLHPGTIVMRNVTLVTAFGQARTAGSNDVVPNEHPQAVRAGKAFVVTQYQQTDPRTGEYATRDLVIDDCLFDLTQNDGPFAAVRGVGTILIEDSTFIARESRNGYLDIDDRGTNPSGTLILENNVSPADSPVFLRVRGQVVMRGGAKMTLHTPGTRLEIDIETLQITERPMQFDEITTLESPLKGRTDQVPSGITPQPAGAVLDMGTAAPVYRRAG